MNDVIVVRKTRPSKWQLAVLSLAIFLIQAPTIVLAQQESPGDLPLNPPATRLPPAQRIVAIGDVHGDLSAALEALTLASAIDDAGQWIGGDLVVVQTGDQIDRGDDDRAVLDLFDRLADEAAAVGGAVVSLNGNHEIMNVQGDARYISPEAFDEFEEFRRDDLPMERLEAFDASQRARIGAFLPGGPYALILAERNVAVIVGDTVFVHGGVLPSHVEYGIERINRDVVSWIRGRSEELSELAYADDSPWWSRHYSVEPDTDDCLLLEKALHLLGATRMVVGHSIQGDEISSACDDRVWRIDTGMSEYYRSQHGIGSVTALEIVGDQVRPLRP